MCCFCAVSIYVPLALNTVWYPTYIHVPTDSLPLPFLPPVFPSAPPPPPHTHSSIQHVQAISEYKAHNAPGEKPKLLRVYEQRMTNVVVHMLIRESTRQIQFVCVVVPWSVVCVKTHFCEVLYMYLVNSHIVNTCI